MSDRFLIFFDISDYLYSFVCEANHLIRRFINDYVSEKEFERDGQFPSNTVDRVQPYLSTTIFLHLSREAKQTRLLVRKEKIWSKGRNNACGCTYDAFFDPEADLYIFPNVHIMLDCLYDMYEMASNGSSDNVSPYSEEHRTVRTFYGLVATLLSLTMNRKELPVFARLVSNDPIYIDIAIRNKGTVFLSYERRLLTNTLFKMMEISS